MADNNKPTTNFTNTLIENSTISDFYTRLNALRHMTFKEANGTSHTGTTNVRFSAPGAHTIINDVVIDQVEAEIRSTQSAIPPLIGIDINTYVPATSDKTLIESIESVHPVEWQIGQLESACAAFFSSNRQANKVSNFVTHEPGTTVTFTTNRTSDRVANHTSNVTTTFTNNFVTQFTANFTTQYTANFGTQFTANFVTQHGTNFGTVKTSNLATQSTCRTVHSSKRTSNSSNYSTGAPFMYMQFNWVQGGDRSDQRATNKKGNNSAGTTTKSSNKASQNSSKRGANHGTFCTTVFNAQRGVNHTTQRGTNFTAQRGVNHTAQRGVNHTSVAGHTCTAHFTNNLTQNFVSFCGAVFTTFKGANNVDNNSANFSLNTATFYSNHSTFVVTPLSDTQ